MSPTRCRRWLLSATLAAAVSASAYAPVRIAHAQPAAKPTASKPTTPATDENAPPAGVDISKLDDFGRKVFFRVVTGESSACGKGHSLLYSAKHDAACRPSFYAVRYVAHLVDSGFTDSEITDKLDRRFRSDRHPHIDVSAAPSKGSPSAKISIVEFVDYECPHCRHAQALMRKVIEEYPNDVRVFFKHYPLSSHPNARLAAEAAVAAHKQGKFWPYNERVWANSDSLTPALLEKLAKDAGLDMAKWRTDMASSAVKDRVQDDRNDGNDLGISATPTIYINGRKYGDPLEINSIKDWIDEELGR
jgi:thiol-disulfide isomerase/thioredoxin